MDRTEGDGGGDGEGSSNERPRSRGRIDASIRIASRWYDVVRPKGRGCQGRRRDRAGKSPDLSGRPPRSDLAARDVQHPVLARGSAASLSFSEEGLVRAPNPECIIVCEVYERSKWRGWSSTSPPVTLGTPFVSRPLPRKSTRLCALLPPSRPVLRAEARSRTQGACTGNALTRGSRGARCWRLASLRPIA